MTYDRHRPGYVRRRLVRALVGYTVALVVALGDAAVVVVVWGVTR